MAVTRILGISASLQSVSYNRALVEACTALLPPGVEFTVHHGLETLPHYNSDLDNAEPPNSVSVWRRALAGADGVVIACPEYGHGMPGTLKNALDWVVGSGEFVGKPVAVTAAVAGAGRGEQALASLVTTLHAIDAVITGPAAIVVPRGSVAPDGTLSDPSSKESLIALLTAFVATIPTLR